MADALGSTRCRPPPEGLDADLLAIGCLEVEAPAVEMWLEEVAPGRRWPRGMAARGWKGKEEQLAQTDGGAGAARRLRLYGLGLGQQDSLLRQARALAAARRRPREARQRRGSARSTALVLPAHVPRPPGAGAAGRVLRALALAAYRFDRFLSDREKPRPGLERLAAVVPPPGEEAAYRAALPAAQVVAWRGAVGFARDLAELAGQRGDPGLDAKSCARVEMAGRAPRSRGHCRAGRRRAARQGDGRPARRRRRLCASAAPGAPAIQGDHWPRVALVGGGITFDTGGIPIKPAAAMSRDEVHDMRRQSCARRRLVQPSLTLRWPGGACRPGAAVRRERPSPPTPTGRATSCARRQRDGGDHLTDFDAEGRMILGRTPWPGSPREAPDALVELSTLTGACVIALGHQAAGLFSPDDALAGEPPPPPPSEGERLWRPAFFPGVPRGDEGSHADLRNSAGRLGGASLAAAFLSQFVGDVQRWALPRHRRRRQRQGSTRAPRAPAPPASASSGTLAGWPGAARRSAGDTPQAW